jgi:hypothetical protein
VEERFEVMLPRRSMPKAKIT